MSQTGRIWGIIGAGLDSGALFGCDILFSHVPRMVYRPPKKKLAGPGSPANAAGSSNRPSSTADDSGNPLKGDDRNLVKVDDSYAQASFEDRSWLFWQRHGNKVIGVAVGLCATVIIWQGWKLYQAHELENLQTVYQSADGPAALQTFAQGNPDSNLGKVAQLQAADALFKNKQFKEAAAAYAQAVTLWGKDPIAQRARLGQAMSVLQGGDTSGGQKQLEDIYNDAALADTVRGEAGFDLALLAYQANDAATVSKWLDEVKKLPEASQWAGEAKRLADLIPVISDMKLTATPSTSSTSLIPGGGDLREAVQAAASGTSAAPAPDVTSVVPISAPPAATTPPPAPTPTAPGPAATTSSPAPMTPTPVPVAPATSPSAPAASTAKPAAPTSTVLPNLVN